MICLARIAMPASCFVFWNFWSCRELKDIKAPSLIQQIQLEEERILLAAISERKRAAEAARKAAAAAAEPDVDYDHGDQEEEYTSEGSSSEDDENVDEGEISRIDSVSGEDSRESVDLDDDDDAGAAVAEDVRTQELDASAK